MIRILAILFALTTCAFAQVKQSGNVTPGHAACWTTSGVVQDCGTAAIPYLTTLGTWGQGPTFCSLTALPASGAWQSICLGGTTSGGAEIYVQNYGSASAQPLTLKLNGSTYQFPFSGSGSGNVVGPGTTAVGCAAPWANTVGTLLANNCALQVSGSNVITNNIYGGASAGSGLTLLGTTNGSPSGDFVITQASIVQFASYANVTGKVYWIDSDTSDNGVGYQQYTLNYDSGGTQQTTTQQACGTLPNTGSAGGTQNPVGAWIGGCDIIQYGYPPQQNSSGSSGTTINFSSAVPPWVIVGMAVTDATTPGNIPSNTTVATVSTSSITTNNSTTVANNDQIQFNGITGRITLVGATALGSGGIVPDSNQAYSLGWPNQMWYDVETKFLTAAGVSKLAGVTMTAAAPTVAASQVGFGSTVVAAGSDTCPSGTVGGQTVQGCAVINVAGTTRYLPYF